MTPEIKPILDLLIKQYGNREFKPHHDPLAELVQTILSQNTSDINSRPAFKALKAAFGSWEKILDAGIEEIAKPIQFGGLGRIKAERIKRSLQEIQRLRGMLDLDFLADMPVSEAREWLKQLPGVGNKTANCVLLFALGRPALPVDTHIFRVAKRLGLIPDKCSLDEAHVLLENMVPPENIYQFHVLMIDHGRQTCIARHPRCLKCYLKDICPSYKMFMGTPLPSLP